MELNEFIKVFAEQFDETDAEIFTADTEYKAVEEWDSMRALTIMAMVDDEYDIKIKAEDIRNTETIHDLYELVCSRMGKND